MGRFRVAKITFEGHSRSLLTALFDRHMISSCFYSNYTHVSTCMLPTFVLFYIYGPVLPEINDLID